MSEMNTQPQDPMTQPAGEEGAAPAAPMTPEEGVTPEVAQPTEGEEQPEEGEQPAA